MLTTEPIEGRLKPPWWRTVPLMVVTFFFSLSSAVYSPASHLTNGDGPAWAVLATFGAMMISLLGSVALIWRDRRPVAFASVAAVLPLLLPVGNVFGYVGLSSLIGRRRGAGVWAVAALTAIASTWVVINDVRAQPREASFLKSVLGPQGADPLADATLPVPVVVTVAVLGWGVSVGLGLLMRWRRQSEAARNQAQSAHQTSERLGDEVARRAERERIAREVHDVMGHRLSLLTLHAGALEANTEDAELKASAQLIRQGASGAMDDLRSLLSVLREPLDEQTDIPLTMLPDVVDESFGAGQQLVSSIFIQDAELADPALSRAVYRIVQELLTNSRKHAPGRPVRLHVTGGPATGISIDVRNPHIAHDGPDPTPTGGRRGLAGISERAELLGGGVIHGLDDDGSTFRVRVELPWRQRPDVAAPDPDAP